MRIDKYLWNVRLYKTRSLATEACKSNKILLEDAPIKPAKEVSAGDVIKIRRGPVWYHYQVLGFPKNRVGAKLVPEFLADVTPPDEIVKIEIMRQQEPERRAKGSGRPTKKERRNLDRLRG